MASERRRIGLREVRALPPHSEQWDETVRGFGIRRQAGRDVSFVLLYRTQEGRTRRFTIGKAGSPWTPDTARAEAVRLLGRVVNGADPAADKRERRHARTVGELCAQYLAEAEAGRILGRNGKPKRPLTLEYDRGRVVGHIVPLLGRLPVAAVTRLDVEHFMHAVAAGETKTPPTKTKPRGISKVRGGRAAASRTVGLLGGIFNYAVAHGMRADNPVSRVRRFADVARERRLNDDEYAMLGVGLRQAEGAIWSPAIACLWFLALTGWRSGEAVALRWADVDMVRRVAVLADSKTGKSVRPLGTPALGVLSSMPRLAGTALVFPPTKGSGVMAGSRSSPAASLRWAAYPPT
jgi:integrase